MRYSASKISETLKKTGLEVVQGHIRLLLDAIVNIALSGTVFELFDAE